MISAGVSKLDESLSSVHEEPPLPPPPPELTGGGDVGGSSGGEEPLPPIPPIVGEDKGSENIDPNLWPPSNVTHSPSGMLSIHLCLLPSSQKSPL